MASGLTNKGAYEILNMVFRGETPPTNFYVALVTADDVPTQDTDTLGDLTEIAAGNGYSSGGYQLDRNSTDFDTLNEDDTNNKAVLQIKNVTFTASGGSIPASGNDARYAVLTDDNATVANRKVYAWFDLGAAYSVADGDALTLVDLEVDLTT